MYHPLFLSSAPVLLIHPHFPWISYTWFTVFFSSLSPALLVGDFSASMYNPFYILDSIILLPKSYGVLTVCQTQF